MGFLIKRLTKIRFVIIITLALLVLVAGCTDNNYTDNDSIDSLEKIGIINATELTKKEENLIKGIGATRFFVFDYSIDQSDQIKVDFWVEYYYKGEYKENLLGIETMLNKQEEKGQLVISNIAAQDHTEIWNLSILTGDSSISSTKNEIALPKDMNGMTWDRGVTHQEIYLNQATTLAVITGGSGQVSGVAAGVYENDEVAIKELMKNDYVYIFKVRFSNLDE